MMGKIVALIAVAVPCPWLCSVEDVEAQPQTFRDRILLKKFWMHPPQSTLGISDNDWSGQE